MCVGVSFLLKSENAFILGIKLKAAPCRSIVTGHCMILDLGSVGENLRMIRLASCVLGYVIEQNSDHMLA